MKRTHAIINFIAYAFIFCISLSPSLLAEGSDHPNVEGTMYDNRNPKDSFAMINGQPYKAGDTVGHFVVTEIFANGVKLKDSLTGEEKSISVGENQAVSVPKTSESKGQNPAGGIGKIFAELTGKNKANDAGLRPALLSLKKAIMEYKSEVGRFPENIAVLVQEGRINPQIADGVGNYEFSYERLGQSFTLYAEPRWPTAEALYYFMDDIGRLRVEQGRRADEKSKLVEF